MSDLYKYWISFCEGDVSLDKSEFLTLLHTEVDDFTLFKSLRYFAHTEQLVLNVKRFWRARKNRTENRVVMDAQSASMMAIKDLRQKSVACERFGETELVNIINRVTPVIVYSKEEFELVARNDWPNCEFQVVLGDYFHTQMVNDSDNFYALLEAFYGAANSYDMQWYLASPLIKIQLNFELHLILWEAGYDVALSEDHLVLFNNNAGRNEK